MSTLEKFRKRLNLTQEELAEKSGVGRSTIAKIEEGKAIPRPETLRRLCQVLGVNESRLRAFTRSVDRKANDAPLPRSETDDQAGRIEQGGIAQRLPDGTYRIFLDEYMPEQVQLAVFGASVPTLSVKPKVGLLRPTNGAFNSLHVRDLLDDVLHTLAVEAEDLPSLDEVTAHGVVLRSVWIDGNEHEVTEHCQLAFVPWSHVLGISTVMQATSRQAVR